MNTLWGAFHEIRKFEQVQLLYFSFAYWFTWKVVDGRWPKIILVDLRVIDEQNNRMLGMRSGEHINNYDNQLSVWKTPIWIYRFYAPFQRREQIKIAAKFANFSYVWVLHLLTISEKKTVWQHRAIQTLDMIERYNSAFLIFQ